MRHEPEGATPLTEDEQEGLVPEHISTREELNEWEHANIEEAELWVFGRKRSDFLTNTFVRELHRKMFDNTWDWAGQFRRSEKNIGVPATHIGVMLQDSINDVLYWIAN